jgi:hypothetical protein
MAGEFEALRENLAARAKSLARVLRRRSFYRATFDTPTGAHVLADLQRFCRANRTSISFSPVSGLIDSHAMAVAEGRREVWLWIQKNLNLDEAKLKTMKENIDE